MAKVAFLTLTLAATTFAVGSCPNNGTNSRTISNKGAFPSQHYQTVNNTPPQFSIDRVDGAALAPGYIFLGGFIQPETKIPRYGLLIMTDNGELVFDGGAKLNGFNFQTQKYQNEDVLTFWTGVGSGEANGGHGYGGVSVLNQTYQAVARVCPDLDLPVPDNINYQCWFDFHESEISDRNTLLTTAYELRTTDLSQVDDGPEAGFVLSGMIIETDIATGDVLFQWSSIDHVPATKTQIPRQGRGENSSVPMDYFHINSIQRVGDNYLINSRQTWSSYLIAPDGSIIWEFNGETGGDFGPLPDGGSFEWAHHSRLFNVSDDQVTLTVFNNDSPTPLNPGPPTSGLSFILKTNPFQPAILDRRVLHNPDIFSYAEGSYSAELSNGNQFLDYGPIPVVAEFDINGNQLWTARFGPDGEVSSYRAFKKSWVGTPATKPVLLVKSKAGATCRTAYVSWNGSTDIDGWAVFTGNSVKTLKKTGTATRAGFETSFGVSGKCVQVGAVRKGVVIRLSNVQCSS